MRISRLYVTNPLVLHECIILNDESAHYLRNVLRLRKAQHIIIFNGLGGEYQGLIKDISRKQVAIELQEYISRHIESKLHVTLGLGISRSDRMDFAIQKSIELGVTDITPLQTEHCAIRLTVEKKQNKVRHWQKIVQHATEQSGRTFKPPVQDIASFDPWVQQQSGLKLFLDPYATQLLNTLKPTNQSVTILTGPEGGFSEQEQEQAQQAGFIPIQLGPRILRTETAALAALTAVQLLWGDLGGKND